MKSILLDFNSLCFRTLPRVYIVANTLNVGWLWFEIILFFDGWEEYLREVIDEDEEIWRKQRQVLEDKLDELHKQKRQAERSLSRVDTYNERLVGSLNKKDKEITALSIISFVLFVVDVVLIAVFVTERLL